MWPFGKGKAAPGVAHHPFLHSFTAANARISDHYTESQRFWAHIDREARAGRDVRLRTPVAIIG